jgi:CRISPR/Cas system CSM-associated protein Csm3 (group 7 of RAMP superfamily)
MARHISCRYELSARLRAVTALAVSSGAEERGVDLAIARDGHGRPYVPGTSLAGALRAWSLLGSDPDLWHQLWGWQATDGSPQGREPKGEAQGWASRIWVEDGIVELPQGASMEEIRDGIAIDRGTGAAAKGFKYERAVLPAGTVVTLRLTCAVEEEHEAAARALLQRIWLGLRSGQLWLGAARSRGLGRLELLEGSDRLLREQLGGREEVLTALRRRVRGEAPDEAVPLSTGTRLEGPAVLCFHLHWRPVGPLMVRASTDGLSVDSLPLTVSVDGQRALLLPGSSIKGALRARAERILRTLFDQGPTLADLPQQLLPHPLIGWLFGTAPPGEDSHSERDTGTTLRPGLAALWIADCLSRSRIEEGLWAQVESARRLGPADLEVSKGPEEAPVALPDPSLREVLDGSPTLRDWDPVVRVAIDRWTGGAAEERLFSTLEPHGVEWNPVEIVVHLERLPGELHEPATALLLLVLDDLSRRELPLGFATNRGSGDLEVQEVAIRAWRTDQLSTLAGSYPTNGQGLLAALESARPAQLADLRSSWERWLASQAKGRSEP